MIVNAQVQIKISSSNINYWRNLGYACEFKHPRWDKSRCVITVNVRHLKEKSNVRVDCWCERCGVFYTNRYSRNVQYCESCCNHFSSIGNKHGKANKGKKLEKLTGKNHPRYNPNRKDFLKFQSRVRWLTEKTYKENSHILNPECKTRALCGVDGAYQLDHIVSVKKGYELNMSAEELSDIKNLQLLPWKVNRKKWK